jgi:hypothetical protein
MLDSMKVPKFRPGDLIKAAPELYNLARLVAEHFEGTEAPLGLVARVLIAKAEGRCS